MTGTQRISFAENSVPVPPCEEHSPCIPIERKTTQAWKFHMKYPSVLKSKVAFGGGLILVGPDREKKTLTPKPNPGDFIDEVGQPSPLESSMVSYIGIRHLENDEVQKLAPGHDFKEALRPADSLDPGPRDHPSKDTKPTVSGCDSSSFAVRKENRRKDDAAFPAVTSQNLYNQYCENLMEGSYTVPDLVKTNRKWGAKKLWRKQLPPTIDNLPIYTIRVRWKIRANLPCYTLELVHSLLSRHGRIKAIGQVSANSAIVVFCDVESARRALKCCTCIGSPFPLISSWWFPEMNNYNRMMHEQKIREEKRIIVQPSESTIRRMEFKKIQEKCLIQLKKYQNNLSYDKNNFVP